MGTPYEIDINMSQTTVNELSSGGYSLFAFKGVQTAGTGGQPSVWLQTGAYSVGTKINWEEYYEAYTSFTVIQNGAQIQASASYPITLGQELVVTSPQGTGQVINDGPVLDAISINNESTPPTQFTCGIAQPVNGQSAAPICAFPLYGTGLDTFVPVETVVLMFAAGPVDAGTVIVSSFSQGVLISLTGVTDRTVFFDINAGWSWGGASWAQTVPAGTALAPLLCEQSPALAKRALLAGRRPALATPHQAAHQMAHQAHQAANGSHARVVQA